MYYRAGSWLVVRHEMACDRSDICLDGVPYRGDFCLSAIGRHSWEFGSVPREGERQRQLVTHVAGDRYAEDLWAGNSSSGRELTKGCKCYRGLYCLCAIKECVGGVCSSRNISEEVEDHLYGS